MCSKAPKAAPVTPPPPPPPPPPVLQSPVTETQTATGDSRTARVQRKGLRIDLGGVNAGSGLNALKVMK